jgi:hypothetical protein
MTHYKKTSIRKKYAKRRSNTKNKSRKQSLWKMKGCAKHANMTGGCGCGIQANNTMLGGGACAGDILAYPNSNYSCTNNLAYTGRGGKKEGFNSQYIYPMDPLGGGGTCGGDNMPSGASYPSGAMGSPWTPSPSTWPGVAGIQADSNYLAYNNYSYPQADRMLINTEAIPFAYGGKSNKSKKHTFRKHMRKYKTTKHKNSKNKKNKKYQKGGLPSLGILTDIENTWNTLRGNNLAPSPLPFNNQLENPNQLEELNM